MVRMTSIFQLNFNFRSLLENIFFSYFFLINVVTWEYILEIIFCKKVTTGHYKSLFDLKFLVKFLIKAALEPN